MPAIPPYLKLAPIDAIEYFRQKSAIPTENWDEFEAEQHDFAYTVAGLTRADLLEAMRFLIEEAIAKGNSFETFNKQFDRLIARRGGELTPLPAGPDDWRKRITFETPIRRAYAAGRLKQMRDPDVVKARPFWQWSHGDSPKDPRPEHVELNKKVFPADDKFWDVAYPPCGYGCFAKGTPVATPEGWKAIDSVKAGDLVIGGSGNIQPVTAAHIVSYAGKVFRVISKGIGETLATPNHRFLTLRGWIRADHLQLGDILVQVPQLALVNIFVDDINQSNSTISDTGMTTPFQWKSANRNAFDSKLKLWQKDINPERRHPMIEKLTVIDPLQSHRFATSSARNIEEVEQFHDGMIAHLPSIAELLNRHFLLNVEEDQGFTSGYPLDLFNSLHDFRGYALSHAKLNPVDAIEQEYYTGNVYDLTVNEESSYCLRTGIVHNCKCRVFSLKKRQVEAMGLKVSTPPDPMTIAEKGFQRAPGTTPQTEREEVLQRGLERLSPDLRSRVEADLSQRGLLRNDSDRMDEPTRPGHTWVDDHTVKGGGYWRKGVKRPQKASSAQRSRKRQALLPERQIEDLTLKPVDDDRLLGSKIHPTDMENMQRMVEFGRQVFLSSRRQDQVDADALEGKLRVEEKLLREEAEQIAGKLMAANTDVYVGRVQEQNKHETEEFNQLEAEAKDLQEKHEILSDRLSDTIKKLIESKGKRLAILENTMLRLREEMAKTSPMKPSEVADHVSSIAIDDGMQEGSSLSLSVKSGKILGAMEQRNISRELTDIVDFIGAKPAVKRIYKESDLDGRAYTKSGGAEINVGNSINRGPQRFRQTLAHEIGHGYEIQNPLIYGAARAWRHKRSDSPVPIQINNLPGQADFSPEEYALHGRFMHPYAGKLYPSELQATEVVSMGLEMMTDESDMAKFYDTDRGHFFFTLGVIGALRSQQKNSQNKQP